jgi:general secretion pathway protein D
LIEASKTRVDHLSRLIAEMDKPAGEKAETVKLVPNKGVSDLTAKDLSEQIHRMVAMRAQADQPVAGNQAAGNPLTGDDAEDESSLNLRGDVNVQAMQDLGILILKGNEADVRKVEAIIKQLEEMSVGSLPDIHLLGLKFVNSEAMAELMTSVYEQLTELRNRGTSERKTAAFLPVVQPNSLLIISPAIELESILALADELDRRTDPESEFKVFSLRNAIASQVAASIETFYADRPGLGTRIRVLADARTNAIVVQGRANDLEEIAALVEKFDTDAPGAVHRVEIVELKHATAETLAEIINTAIQSVSSPPQQVTGGGGGGNQGAQELRDGKSAALEFLATAGGGKELIKSGILVDVRVNADPRSNSLIISAPEASMPLLKALATQLDQPPSAVASIKVFALQNADAELSVELLTSLFENQNQEDQLGVQIDGTQGSSSSLIPVQFSADIRTNTVLAIGGEESLSVVEAILLRLDSAESRQRRTQVIPLRNVLASVVADALETFLEQQQDLQDSSGLISNIERMRQEVIIAPDDNSNSLIVSASPEYFEEISQIIGDLDANPPQVIIQALIVEVQLDNTDEFGVELGFQDPTLFTRSIVATANDLITINQTTNVPGVGSVQNTNIVSQSATPGFNFNNTAAALGNNNSLLQSSKTVGSQGISNFSLGRQNGDLGFGGFVFSAQSDAVSVLVRALAARRTVHVLSRPQIRTTHNNVASIQVGQQVPVVNGVSVTNNIVTPSIEQQDVGIILRVTPRVTPDGNISMEVYAEKSSLSGGGVPVFTDAASGNVVESVIIDSAIADTTVSVPNGQTIVIGGMITKSDETLERKVPWLGDLPLIGKAFRYDGTNTARTELLIFLTPRIIYGDADSELIKQVEAERMHFVESEAEEIHGPLYSVPSSEADHYRMPQSEFMVPREPTQMEMEQYQPSDGAIVLPPQANSNAAAKGEIVTTSGTNLDPKVMQALAKSAAKNNKGSEADPEDKAAAAEWVRKVLEEKRAKAAADTKTTVQQTSASQVKDEKNDPMIIQAGSKRQSTEPIRTLSASEAGIDDADLETVNKEKRSWSDRFLRSKK